MSIMMQEKRFFSLSGIMLFATFFLGHPLQAYADVIVAEGNPSVTLEGMLIGAEGVAVDFDGNIYIADTQNHVIRKYTEKGIPTLVFGRECHAGNADGSPVDVRFNLPTKLAVDNLGNILVVDHGASGPSRILRIDVRTLQTKLIADLDANVDGTQMFDVISGLILNKGILKNVEIGDIAVHPSGDIFVAATDNPPLRITQYLIRIGSQGQNARVVATTSTLSLRNGSRGIAIDRFGNVFISFTGELAGGDVIDSIYKFPQGNIEGFSRHFSLAGVGKVNAMGSGLGKQLYFFLEDPTGLIQVISTVDPDTTLGFLQAVSNNPTLQDARVQDVTGDRNGNIYAINYRLSTDNKGIFLTTDVKLSKLDRFIAADVSLGSLNGDTDFPTVSISNLVNNIQIITPITLQAMAGDNSNKVTVQFQIDEKPFGLPLKSPPFNLELDPSLLTSGKHTLVAIARDPAGNTTSSDTITFFNSSGLPNINGEIFLDDVALTGVPAGIAIDQFDKVYIAQNNGSAGHVFVYSSLSEQLKSFGLSPDKAFRELAGMGTDFFGNILILDRDTSSFLVPRVHRYNSVSNVIDGQVTLNEQQAIDASKIWNFDTQNFEDLTTLSICNIFSCVYVPVNGVDVAGAPNGDVLVGVEGETLPQAGSDTKPFLVRLSGNSGNRALALSNTFRGGPGVTVDSKGQIFTTFPTVLFNNQDILARFPANQINPVGEAFAGFENFQTKGMGKDNNDRIYVGVDALSGSSPGLVAVFDSDENNSFLTLLGRQILDQVVDVAVDSLGNVYVTSKESRPDINFRIVSRVTRFNEALSGVMPLDSDNDGIFDDGSGSGFIGDFVCNGGASTFCDDNCPLISNPDQADIDADGKGNSCDTVQDCEIGLDTDNDGITDCDEVNLYGTDLQIADTDQDGLPDSVEVGLFGFDEDPGNKTDPLNPDSDGDGLFDGDNGIDPCEDCNNNGRFDMGETDPNQVDDVSKTIQIQFAKGFNLFSYPFAIPADINGCIDLIGKLGSAEEINYIKRFNSSTQAFEQCDSVSGNDFEIVPGAAYIVNSAINKSLEITGVVKCPTITLLKGVNFIGYQGLKNSSCFTLLRSIDAAQSFQRFNRDAGRFESCFKDQSGNAPVIDGLDFPVVTGKGYILNMLNSGSYRSPGCD